MLVKGATDDVLFCDWYILHVSPDRITSPEYIDNMAEILDT